MWVQLQAPFKRLFIILVVASGLMCSNSGKTRLMFPVVMKWETFACVDLAWLGSVYLSEVGFSIDYQEDLTWFYQSVFHFRFIILEGISSFFLFEILLKGGNLSSHIILVIGFQN